MKFYFCETCGKRITEKDVEAGQARNKKLKGVYCAQCSVGVMTMEMLPVTEDEARKILGKSPTPAAGTPLSPGSSGGKPKRETTAIQVVVRKSGDSESHVSRPAPNAPARSKSQSAMVGVAAGLAVAVVLGLVLIFTGGEKAKSSAEAKGDGSNERGNPTLPVTPAKPDSTKAARLKPPAYDAQKEGPSPSKTEDAASSGKSGDEKTGDAAKAEPAVTPPAVAEDGKEKSLALLKLDDFQGGGVSKNFWNKGKDGRAIWGKHSTRPLMSATFKLDAAPAGEGIVRALTLRHERKEPCKVSIKINETIIFVGPDPATNWDWTRHEFRIPAGTLKAGENWIGFMNCEDTNAENQLPWYMIHEVEILAAGGPGAKPATPDAAMPEAGTTASTAGAPAENPVAAPAQAGFPSVLTEDQRILLKFYNDTFAKLRNQQQDAALAAARGTQIAEAKPLAALLERADALNKKALEELNKKPPASPIQFKFKNEELTGQLKRVEGPFAWVVSKGLEVRVGVEELPAEIFLEALALDATKPEGQYDLVAFLFASGRAEAAVAQAKKMDPEKAGELMDMLEHYRMLQRLGLFEDAVLAIEDAIKEAKTQDALRMLAGLKKSFSDLATGEQQERVANLEARAEATKLANRIKELFSGEVLALRDDLYIEIKYDFTKAGASREDFRGPVWVLNTSGLIYNQRYGADADLQFKAVFQPKLVHAEYVQSAAGHDFSICYMGKVAASVRWVGSGQINTAYTDKVIDIFKGKPWKHPSGNGDYCYIFERTDKEIVFKLDQTEHSREKLPAQAAEEQTCVVRLSPSRTIVIKEAVFKGFLDKDWVQDALKNLPQPGATGYLPGLWASFHSGDATDRAKTYHFSRMEPKLSGDFGGGAPDKSMPIDNFTELLEGYIKIEADGEYQFELWGDDYLSLKIGETLVAECSSGQIKRTKQEKGKITLAKGYYPVKARFVDIGNVAKFFTKWKPPGAANGEEVPASVFWHDAKQEEKK